VLTHAPAASGSTDPCLDPSPFVFLIDPASQVIRKTQPIHIDSEDVEGLLKILAIKDRTFFIRKGIEDMARIAIVAEPGPNSVRKRFRLLLPRPVC